MRVYVARRGKEAEGLTHYSLDFLAYNEKSPVPVYPVGTARLRLKLTGPA